MTTVRNHVILWDRKQENEKHNNPTMTSLAWIFYWSVHGLPARQLLQIVAAAENGALWDM